MLSTQNLEWSCHCQHLSLWKKPTSDKGIKASLWADHTWRDSTSSLVLFPFLITCTVLTVMIIRTCLLIISSWDWLVDNLWPCNWYFSSFSSALTAKATLCEQFSTTTRILSFCTTTQHTASKMFHFLISCY